MDLGSVLGGRAEADDFARALEPRTFRFPGDHGPHPRFRSEWWYLTAHLRDETGRPHAVQFTLFRQGLRPADASVRLLPDAPASAWRTDQVWMAHLALGAPETGHRAVERYARGSLGLAGVEASPFRAWLEDWRLAAHAGGDPFPLELVAGSDAVSPAFGVELTLEQTRPLVLQGEAGLSRKSAREGNASYYYSFTRLEAAGHLVIGEERRAVQGLAWLDREWSTSALDPDQTGWDWFALHLADGRDLMIYRIRRDDGSIDAASAGTLVHPDGRTESLAPEDWRLEPVRRWRDERGVAWPVAWRLEVPSAGVAGVLEPVREDQLNRLSVRYWEGMVCLRGTVAGCGFLEMTGYGEARGESQEPASPASDRR